MTFSLSHADPNRITNNNIHYILSAPVEHTYRIYSINTGKEYDSLYKVKKAYALGRWTRNYGIAAPPPYAPPASSFDNIAIRPVEFPEGATIETHAISYSYTDIPFPSPMPIANQYYVELTSGNNRHIGENYISYIIYEEASFDTSQLKIKDAIKFLFELIGMPLTKRFKTMEEYTDNDANNLLYMIHFENIYFGAAIQIGDKCYIYNQRMPHLLNECSYL